MRFRILPAAKGVTVHVEGQGVSLSFPAASIAQAHKLIAIGRDGGWDAVMPKKGK